MRISDLSPRARELHELTNFDPFSIVTQLLSEEGHPDPSAWTRYLPAECNSADISDNQKRLLVNTAFRHIFGNYQIQTGINTEHPRYCLVDKGELNVWLVLFYQSVIPAVVEHQLPNRLDSQ